MHRPDSISTVWEYDRACSEERKDLACHPLDRNRLQMQDNKCLDQRKVNTQWIIWQEKMMGFKGLQIVKVWEDIDRILHPPTNKCKICEGQEYLQVSRLHKIECSIRVKDTHIREVWGDSCGDRSHKQLQEVTKVATCSEFERFKTLQRLHNSQILALTKRRK
jgi:hypothetical protein